MSSPQVTIHPDVPGMAGRIPGMRSGVGWVFGAQAIGLGLGLLTSSILARGLGPDRQGTLSVALLVPALFAMIAGGGLYAANGFFAGNRQISLQALMSNSVAVAGIGTALSGVLLALVWAGGLLPRALPGVELWMIAIGLVILPILLLRQSASALLLGLQQLSRSSRVDVTQASVYLAAATILVLVGGFGVGGGLLAYLVAVGAALLVAARWLPRGRASLAPRLDSSVARSTLGFGIRGSAGVVLQFFTYRLDLMLVNVLVAASAAGYYAISARLAELLWILPGAVGTVIFSRSSASTASDMDRVTPQAFWVTVGAGVCAALLMALLGPIVIPLFFSAAFAPSYVPMVILLPGALLLGSSSVLANDMVGRGHPGTVSIAALAAFLVTLALDLTLIPAWGTAGAAVASSIAYGVYFAAIMVLYLRVTRMGPLGFARAARLWDRQERTA